MFGDAAAYERFMGRWSARLAPAFLDELRMPDPQRVLDVGSGTGNLTRAVAERWPGCEVIGVDPSVAFVEAARKRAIGRGGRVHFEVGSADALPLDDASVDAALALLVLTFVPDADRAVAQMRGSPGRVACWRRPCGTTASGWRCSASSGTPPPGSTPAWSARTRGPCRSAVPVGSSTCGSAPAWTTSTAAG